MPPLFGTFPLVLGGVESGDPEPCGVHSRDPEIVKTPRAPWHVNYPAISSHLPGIEPEDRVRCGMPGLSTSLSPDHGTDAVLALGVVCVAARVFLG